MCWSANGNELRLHSIVSLEPHAGHGTTGLPAQAVFRFSSEPAGRKERGTIRGAGTGSALAATRTPPSSSPTHALSSPGAAAEASAVVNDGAFAVTGTGAASPCGSGSPTSAGAGKNAAGSLFVGVGRNGERHVVGSSGGGGVSPRERGTVATGAVGKLSVRAVEAVETRDGRTVLVCLVSKRGLPSEVRRVFTPKTLLREEGEIQDLCLDAVLLPLPLLPYSMSRSKYDKLNVSFVLRRIFHK